MASAIAHEREIDRIVGADRARFIRILKSLAAALAQDETAGFNHKRGRER